MASPPPAYTYSNPFTNDIQSADQENATGDRPTNDSPINARDELRAWDAALAPHRIRSGTTLLNQTPVKTLEFRKKLFNSDLFVWHKTQWHETQIYFAACCKHKPKTPDVTLHGVIVGQDAAGPILGVAHFRFSRHIRFGLGDARNEPGNVAWEEMRNVARIFKKTKYEWQFTESPDWKDVEAGEHPPGTRRFMWRRTFDAADGIETKLSIRNYRLTDEMTGAVVAVFVASSLGNVRKKGELRLFEQLRPKLEVAVVLTCASISEKVSRD